jgi:hypothetical protein
LTGVADDASVVVSETEHDPRAVVMEQVCLVIPVQPGRDAMVAYMETKDFANALRLFSQSQDEFDVWFKRRMAEATGVATR